MITLIVESCTALTASTKKLKENNKMLVPTKNHGTVNFHAKNAYSNQYASHFICIIKTCLLNNPITWTGQLPYKDIEA